MKITTRFAPSPTGNLHIGSIHTALYSWLFARHYNGKFVLRIEDTDFERSNPIFIKSILDGLKWLGLNWDEGPYFQTQRLNRYKKVVKIMLEKGVAYKCFCSMKQLEEERSIQILQGIKPRYNRACRNIKSLNTCNKEYVVRFKNPLSGKVTFDDKIRGKITFNNSELDDLIIQRSNGMPTYNFCVVIDDLDMNITHVIRGEDHINNTPRQINILQSLDAEIPIYAHLSMILDEKGNKISKRKDAIDITQYYKKGFLPEALLNYIIRLGWSYGDKEIFNIVEMKNLFNLEAISKSSSIISTKKLLWLNKYYINNLPLNYISNSLENFMKNKNFNINNGPSVESLVQLLRSRCHTLKDLMKSCRYFYEEFEIFNPIAANKYLIFSNINILEESYLRIDRLSVWSDHNISKIINAISIDTKAEIKEINMVLRVSMTGESSSPSISSVIYFLGQEKSLLRIKKAINYIKNTSVKD